MTIAYSGDSITFPDLSVQNTSPTGFGFKNRIINGDFRIDQRNAGASVNMASVVYPVDRWVALEDTDGAMTAQLSTVAPAGFSNSIICTTTTADSSLAAAQYARVWQNIEGFNVADLGWGTASAQPITVSFLVRSSLTGTFGGSVANSAFNRSYPFTYTISSANTWEQKSVTIAGDTTGTWLTDNGIGLQLNFNLGTGTTYSGTAGAWASATYVSATGAVSVVGTSGATFYITGVQLEKGSTATSFDFRDYGRELIMCQRYYQTLTANARFYSTIAGTFTAYPMSLPVAMRAAPTTALITAPTTVTNVSAAGYARVYANAVSIEIIATAVGAAELAGRVDSFVAEL